MAGFSTYEYPITLAHEAVPVDRPYVIVERDDDGLWITSDVAGAVIGVGETAPESMEMWQSTAAETLNELREVDLSDKPPDLDEHMKGVLAWLEEVLSARSET